jgi:hypothetical protein
MKARRHRVLNYTMVTTGDCEHVKVKLACKNTAWTGESEQ